MTDTVTVVRIGTGERREVLPWSLHGREARKHPAPYHYVLLDEEREARAQIVRNTLLVLHREIARYETMLLDVYQKEATP